MAVTFKYKDKIILRCANAVFGRLLMSISNIIDQKNIKLSKDFSELMFYFEEFGCSGIGFDISEYIHSKKDHKLLVDLVRQGIDKIYSESAAAKQLYQGFYEGFYNGLLDENNES